MWFLTIQIKFLQLCMRISSSYITPVANILW